MDCTSHIGKTVIFPLIYCAVERYGPRITVVICSGSILVAYVVHLFFIDIYRNLVNVLVGVPVFMLGCRPGKSVYAEREVPIIPLMKGAR